MVRRKSERAQRRARCSSTGGWLAMSGIFLLLVLTVKVVPEFMAISLQETRCHVTHAAVRAMPRLCAEDSQSGACMLLQVTFDSNSQLQSNRTAFTDPYNLFFAYPSTWTQHSCSYVACQSTSDEATRMAKSVLSTLRDKADKGELRCWYDPGYPSRVLLRQQGEGIPSPTAILCVVLPLTLVLLGAVAQWFETRRQKRPYWSFQYYCVAPGGRRYPAARVDAMTAVELALYRDVHRRQQQQQRRQRQQQRRRGQHHLLEEEAEEEDDNHSQLDAAEIMRRRLILQRIGADIEARQVLAAEGGHADAPPAGRSLPAAAVGGALRRPLL
eukprot:PLAT8642.1.p1 GENE.PLAT8642.1~~PLAT8642.1.p1  ORF type:complete len:366 (-),score=122.08 PLAT8642.1:881-1864(-)